MCKQLPTRTDRIVKKVKHIINWFVWSLLALHILFLIIIHVPFVQSFIGTKAALALSEKLGTQVSLGRVEIGFPNRIILDQIDIVDQSNEKMFHAGRLTAKIDFLPLINGRISISSAQIFSANVSLYKTDSLAKPNYQFVLDSLTTEGDESTSALNLRINSLIIRHSQVSYDQRDVAQTPKRLNFKHLKFRNISTHIILKTLQEDSLNINIKRLAFNEQSGLNVNKLSLKLEANARHAHLEDFKLQLPNSNLQINEAHVAYDRMQFEKTIQYTAKISTAPLSINDLSFVSPKLLSFNQQLTLNAKIKGSANDITCEKLNITSNDNSIGLAASGTILQLNEQPHWNTHIQQFNIGYPLLSQLQEVFQALPKPLAKFHDIIIKGDASGIGTKAVQARSDILTDAGNISMQIEMDTLQHFNGKITTEDMQLGLLLDNPNLGLLTANAQIKGNPSVFNIDSHINTLEYKSNAYKDIDISGNYNNGDIAGRLKVDNPFIQTDIEGELKRAKRTAIRLNGRISHINPKALNLTDQWGNTRFSGIIDADFIASSLNDAEGSINLRDFDMVTHDSINDTYHLHALQITSGYDEGNHFITVKGDMGEAHIHGKIDWNTLNQSFINYTASKLPTLPGLPRKAKKTDNHFTADLRLTDSNWLNHIFNIPLEIERPLTFRFSLDDTQNQINLLGRAPIISYEGKRYSNAQINITTDVDTMRYDVKVTKEMDDGGALDLNLSGQAVDNNLSTSLLWNNNAPSRDSLLSMHGIINTITQLYENEEGKAEAHIRVLPSRMMVHGTPWTLEPCDILYSSKRLMVDHFSLNHNKQHLIIDGSATESPNDSLTIDMNELEVGYILDLVNFHSVSFDGLATGRITAKQIFSDFSSWAELNVDQFKFQDGRMGILMARVDWNKVDKQIDIDALAYDTDESQTIIKGFVSPVRNDIGLSIHADGSNIEFCNSFTDAFLKDVKGQANGDVTLSGSLSNIDLTGTIVANGQASVKALNTVYTFVNDTVTFIPNDILFNRATIKDQYGNKAYLSGGIHHDHLSDFTFDLDVEADNLLAYDFKDFGDDIVCGTVYATGSADLHGRPGEIIINCNVTPQANSVFVYNATNPDAISKQEFITWKKNASPHTHHIHNTKDEGEDGNLASTTNLYINFIINATPSSTLKVLMDANTGDYISLNGEGNIKATYYNKGPFHMFGTYTVEHGTYGITIQNIIKKNFVFQNGGTLIFGGDPFDANLNLQAQYTVNGVSLSDLNMGNTFSNNTVRVNCLMNILGTPGNPQVEFDFELPTVNSEENQMIRSYIAGQQEMNQQVLYLLGIGRFYTQGVNNAQVQEYGQTQLAMQSFLSGTVSSQINEVLSQVIKSDDWNFGANISTGNEGWHNAEYEGLISGRMLNNRLHINGQFGYRDNATQATPSFIGDFDISYMLNPNGSLAVKAYNQTNDRYFTRSSLNTQGIGFIIKKDFNTLKDLLTWRKKKEKK